MANSTIKGGNVVIGSKSITNTDTSITLTDNITKYKFLEIFYFEGSVYRAHIAISTYGLMHKTPLSVPFAAGGNLQTLLFNYVDTTHITARTDSADHSGTVDIYGIN